MNAAEGAANLPPPPPIAPGPPTAPARWWQILLMAASLIVIILAGFAAFSLSMTTVCRLGAPVSDCDQIKRLISVEFFGQGFLGLVCLVILLRSRLSWGRRTTLVVAVACVAIVLDVVVRHLVSVSPARF